MTAPRSSPETIERLKAVVGEQNVLSSAEEIDNHSRDTSTWIS